MSEFMRSTRAAAPLADGAIPSLSHFPVTGGDAEGKALARFGTLITGN